MIDTRHLESSLKIPQAVLSQVGSIFVRPSRYVRVAAYTRVQSTKVRWPAYFWRYFRKPPRSTRSGFTSYMRLIDKIYIDGSFVTPHGTELFDLRNPATAQVIGRVCLADEEDARTAIAAGGWPGSWLWRPSGK
jgi:hypothetical protein